MSAFLSEIFDFFFSMCTARAFFCTWRTHSLQNHMHNHISTHDAPCTTLSPCEQLKLPNEGSNLTPIIHTSLKLYEQYDTCISTTGCLVCLICDDIITDGVLRPWTMLRKLLTRTLSAGWRTSRQSVKLENALYVEGVVCYLINASNFCFNNLIIIFLT